VKKIQFLTSGRPIALLIFAPTPTAESFQQKKKVFSNFQKTYHLFD